MNARFLAEAIECEARWKKTGLLDGLESRFIRATCAVLLESQRLVNEVQLDEVVPFLPPKTMKNYWLDRKRDRE